MSPRKARIREASERTLVDIETLRREAARAAEAADILEALLVAHGCEDAAPACAPLSVTELAMMVALRFGGRQ